MRHKKKINHLSRTASHRKAMLRNMAISLIMHKRIKTTVAKAKALRTFVEPVINRSKEDTSHSRRTVFSRLQNKEAVNELFRELAPKIAERQGGYTRILKTGNRLGDNAEMCIIELVDYNENLLAAKDNKPAKKKARRSRRGAGAATTAQTPSQEKSEKVAEEAEIVEEVKAEDAAPAKEDKSSEEAK